jgi:hypothetical protein
MLPIYRHALWQIEFHNYKNELKHIYRHVYI